MIARFTADFSLLYIDRLALYLHYLQFDCTGLLHAASVFQSLFLNQKKTKRFRFQNAFLDLFDRTITINHSLHISSGLTVPGASREADQGDILLNTKR